MLNLPWSDLANSSISYLSPLWPKIKKRKCQLSWCHAGQKFSCILLLLWFSQPISDETNFHNLGSEGATMGLNHLWIRISFLAVLKLCWWAPGLYCIFFAKVTWFVLIILSMKRRKLIQNVFTQLLQALTPFEDRAMILKSYLQHSLIGPKPLGNRIWK